MTAALKWSDLLETDRGARAAWSRVSEPDDHVVTGLIAAFGATEALRQVAFSGDPRLARFQPRLTGLDVARDLDMGRRVGAHVLIPSDPGWPSGLDDLANPPVCLWVSGDKDRLPGLTRAVAVVGARACTAYGQLVASELGGGLAEQEIAVVSGAALGIDACAHRGALGVDGLTVAVLAGGIDRPYPSAHTDLITHIARVGLVMSEVAPGSASMRQRFLSRNRLIAAMSLGVVVVEAGLRSGSRNTARTAADLGRVVMAVPGPVTSMSSAGCHDIIRSENGLLVTDAAEVTEAVARAGHDLAPAKHGPVRADDAITGDDRLVLESLPVGRGRPLERIAVTAGRSEAEVRSALGRLAVAGLAGRDASGWRALTRRSPAVRDAVS